MAGAHAHRVFTYMASSTPRLGAWESTGQASTYLVTPKTLLGAIKLCYILPNPAALAGRSHQKAVTEVFVSGERRHSIPVPVAGGGTRGEVMQQKATGYRPTSFGQAMLERASSACHPTGAMEVAARTLLVEPRSTGKEKPWPTLMATFPTEEHATVSAAAAATVPASAGNRERGRN